MRIRPSLREVPGSEDQDMRKALDVLTERMAQKALSVADNTIEVECSRFGDVLATEDEELAGEIRRPMGRFLHLGHVLL